MKTLYLSGPMTGYQGNNYDAFFDAAQRYTLDGYAVINPADNFGGTVYDQDTARHLYMRQDISHVLNADYVVVLDGWHRSPGSRTEVQVAFQLCIPVYSDLGRCQLVPRDLTDNLIGQEREYAHYKDGTYYATHRPDSILPAPAANRLR